MSMENITPLMKLVSDRAEEIRTQLERKHLCTDFFLCAALELASKSVRKGSPLAETAVKGELDRVKKLLKERLGDLAASAKAYTVKTVAAADGGASLGIYSTDWNRALFYVRKNMSAAKITYMSALEVLRVIFEHPTKIMSTLLTISEAPSESISWQDLFTAPTTRAPEAEATEAATEAPARTRSAATSSPTTKQTGLVALADEVNNIRAIREKLLRVVYGQDHAVDAFVTGHFLSLMDDLKRDGERTRPRATYLFAGPPGTGKTFLAEQAALALGLPYRRFDMSEYSEKESNLQFAGSDKVYKNGHVGNVTSFVHKNPKSVLIFDEVEKAHLNVIYLFLQIMDCGRLRDNFMEEEISFRDTIIIFTTNAGKQLYEDPSVRNLSCQPRRVVLKALSDDINPVTGSPYFPPAICSRFASSNVIMFNRLTADYLLQIGKTEIVKKIQSFKGGTEVEVTMDNKVPYAIMFAEGGRADARTVKGHAADFFGNEVFELLRLITPEKGKEDAFRLKKIHIDVSLENAAPAVKKLFEEGQTPNVLVFCDSKRQKAIKGLFKNQKVHFASNMADAKRLLFTNDISIILCDLSCGVINSFKGALNLEDVESEGKTFLTYACEYLNQPVYVIAEKATKVTDEEMVSFFRMGVSGVFGLDDNDGAIDKDAEITALCEAAYQEKQLLSLAKENKVLTYSSAQQMTEDGESAVITLFNLKLNTAVDAQDSQSILDDASRPNVKFSQVIGAEDAKEELAYFVNYMKNPTAFLRKGVKAPRGVLLYGPPGTGKTLLAKAMAGESNVTFLATEGNRFLKSGLGAGPDAIHELFAKARKYAPAILFIDEVDCIAKNRSTYGADNTADVLTALLTELDGFSVETDKPVFVLAATNYSVDPNERNSLDPAILRRFDRKVLVDLPSRAEREAYIRMKVGQNAILELSDGQIENIAVRSTGMSLADIENVIELSMRMAIRQEDPIVNDVLFEEAFMSIDDGKAKKWDKEIVLRTARHEAGHTLVSALTGEMPSYVTIVSRGDFGGYMQIGDQEEKFGSNRRELLARIRTCLAGRAAEQVCYGIEEGLTTGASGDLRQATRIASYMVTQYGMDDEMGLAVISVLGESAQLSERVYRRINEILSQELANARTLIAEHRDALDALVAVLMERNHLREDEIKSVLAPYIPTES